MSRIFEALTRSDETLAKLAVPIDAGKNGQSDARECPPEAREEADPIRTMEIRLSRSSPLLPIDGAHPAAGEQYRILRTNILHYPKNLRTLVVSSATSGDGKTLTAVNTAGVLAMKPDVTVLLIDGDLRRSSLAAGLGLPGEPGLADILYGSCRLQDAVIRVQQFPNLYVLPAGKVNTNPAELLDTDQWRNLCEAVRETFRFVVIDTAPVAAVADYDLVEAVADGVILVVRPDHSNRGLALKALNKVTKEKLVGVVLNCVDDWFLQRNHGNYYYYALTSK